MNARKNQKAEVMDNLLQKAVRTIGVSGAGMAYSANLARPTLPSGVYSMVNTREGLFFSPLEVDNDQPLPVDRNIDMVLAEIKDFYNRRELFQRFGFAHKRGYLLHGRPGCGKSSALRLIEQGFVKDFDGIVLFWNNGGMVAAFVEMIRAQEPDRPILLVCEDIDSQVRAFEEAVLEFLDGQKGLNNLVIVATTNNLAMIPGRIKDRPSRIDRVIEISSPDRRGRISFLAQIGLEDLEAQKLADLTDGFTVAEIKEVVVATLCLGNPLDAVLARIRALNGTISKAPSEDDDDENDYCDQCGRYRGDDCSCGEAQRAVLAALPKPMAAGTNSISDLISALSSATPAKG